MKPLHLLIASLRSSRPAKAENSRHRRLQFDQLEDRRMLAAVAVPSGLIAWWPGDGTAVDISGNGNNGSLQGGATFAPGMVGQAFSLDGISGHVRVPNSTVLNPVAGFSIEAWIKSNSTADGRHIVSKWDDDTGDWSYGLKDHNNDNNKDDKLQIGLSRETHSDLADLSGTTPIVVGQWVHVAMTYDTNTVRLYYNGVLDASQTIGYCSTSFIDSSNTDLLIGAVFTGGGVSENFSGLIDELSLYNRALSAAEIESIVAAGSDGKDETIAPDENDSGLGTVGPCGVMGIDLSFGNLGMVQFFGPGQDYVLDTARLADGRLLVLTTQASGASVLLRLNPNGSLDESFGNGGHLEIEQGWEKLALQGEKIILSSGTWLGRLNSDGSADGTFGTFGEMGWAYAPDDIDPSGFGPDVHYGGGRTIVTDEGILVVGTGTIVTNITEIEGDLLGDSNSGASIIWFTPDGQVVSKNLVHLTPDTSDAESISDAALDDGKIVLVGNVSDQYGHVHFVLARLLSGGSLDPTFAGTGVVLASEHERAARVVTDADDVLVIGRMWELGFVKRYLSNGSLDVSYGDNGRALLDPGFPLSWDELAAARTPSGQLVVKTSDYSTSHILRLNTNGSLDATFGTAGITGVPLAHASSLQITTDGSILVAGEAHSVETGLDIAVIQLIGGDGSLATGDTDGDGITNSVDTHPTVNSSDFSDVANGGATTGTITSRGDQILTIVDAANAAEGVLISASAAGGVVPAEINVEGSTIYVGAGESVTVTHGSVELQVVTGPIYVEFRDANGNLVATADLPSGSGAIFDPEAATLIVAGTSGDDVFALTSTGATLNGAIITVMSGLSLLSLNDGGGSDQFTLTGSPPSSFEVQGGDPIDRLTVTSTSSATDLTDGVITLAEAILFANQHSGPDSIAFNIPTSDPNYHSASGSFTISSGLPTITEQMLIDGYTQPGASPNSLAAGQGTNANLKIEIAGGGSGTGFEISAGAGTTIRGLAINRFFFGFVIRGPSSGTIIEGNFIGTDVAGAAAQANVIGIALLLNTSGNQIRGNLISGNSYGGVVVGAQSTVASSAFVTNTQITGNYIGTDATGLQALPNGMGVALNSTDNSQIGGILPGQANVIAYSTSAAVSIGASGGGYVGHGNTVRGNAIFSNVGLGIDLTTNAPAPDGITQNTGQAIAAVTNGYQNFPDLQFAAGGPTTRIVGSLQITAPDSRPDPALYAIDVYANAAQDRQGQRYLGSFVVSVGSSGYVSFDKFLSANTLEDEYVTATATDAAGNTSEFSAAIVIASGSGDADSDGIGNLIDGAPTTFSNTFSDVGLVGGATTGQITSRGDQILTIVDAANSADGVLITADLSGGAAAATISIDGGASILTLDAGDQVITTHGSVVLNVVAGVVEATFVSDAGQTVATASLAAGVDLTFEPDTVTFVAAPTNDEPVEVVLIGEGGQQATATLSPENQITFEPETFSFSVPPTNSEPVSVVVGGNEIVIAPGTSVQPVQIDIRSGDTQSTVNLASNGVIAVAILSTADFDARDVVANSVLFAGAHAAQSAQQDVNGDGRLDLVLQFRTQDTNLRAIYELLLSEDANADGVLDSSHQVANVSLTGETVDEVLIEGFDNLDLFLAGRALRSLLDQLAASGAI